MSFRARGRKVFVETTEAAELDLALSAVSEATVDRIAERRQRLPVSRDDVAVGPLLRRDISGLHVYFLTTCDPQGDAVLLVVGVKPPAEAPQSLRELIDLASSLRGAAGI